MVIENLIEANSQYILDKTVELIIKNNGKLPYEVIEWAMSPEVSSKEEILLKVAVIYVAKTITNHIPIGGKQADPSKNYERFSAFRFAHCDECAIIDYFKNSPNYPIELIFADDTHDIFAAGNGSWEPDLRDKNCSLLTYEVKANCNQPNSNLFKQGSSVSSLHGATYLLNCVSPGKNTMYPNGAVLWYVINIDNEHPQGFITEDTAPIKEITDISLVNRTNHKYPKYLSQIDINILKDNYLLYNIDEKLKVLNFNWPKYRNEVK